MPPEVASFMYHEVTDDPRGSGFQRPSARPYVLSRRAFRRHVEEMAAGPLRPELLSDLDLNRPGRHLLLTFDDGGRSALDVVDELERYGWKAHFFIVTARIGEPTFLSASAIRQVRGCGHLVGTHSHTHPDIFRALPRARMLEEWRTSVGILEDILGEHCRVGSVPGGDLSRAALECAAEAGLRYVFTSEPWPRPWRLGMSWVLGRFMVKASLAPERFRDLLTFRGWARARCVRWAKLAARRLMGPFYPAYVRHVTRSIPGLKETSA